MGHHPSCKEHSSHGIHPQVSRTQRISPGAHNGFRPAGRLVSVFFPFKIAFTISVLNRIGHSFASFPKFAKRLLPQFFFCFCNQPLPDTRFAGLFCYIQTPALGSTFISTQAIGLHYCSCDFKRSRLHSVFHFLPVPFPLEDTYFP